MLLRNEENLQQRRAVMDRKGSPHLKKAVVDESIYNIR